LTVLDITREPPFTLAAAARLVPPARGGECTHFSTILRWILKGAKAPDGSRVRLEAIRLGGRWFTSREALQRFAEKLTPRFHDAADMPEVRTKTHREKASEQAAIKLDQLGI
jgi:Protein of unknown function (DUF1580)